jgi:hypothetical protein
MAKANKRALTVCLAILASMVIGNISPSHGVSLYSTNAFTNSGFENPPGFTNGTIPGWGREFFDSNYGSATGVDCTQAVTGYCSARLDIAQSDIRLSNQSQTITFGHTSLYQVLPANTYFSNMTDRPDGLNLWLYIQPKFTDYPLVQVRFKAQSTIEMDYLLINIPLLGNGSGNSTNGGEAGKAIKTFVLAEPNLYHWNHVERNVRRDWVSPMRLPSGAVVPGFQLNDTLFRVEIEAYYYKDTSTGKIYGETVWADNVYLYVDSTTPPPPPPPSNYYAAFNFVDATGTSVNNIVKWKLFNSTGQEVIGYNQNSPTLILEPYTVAVYYPTITGQNPEPYLILQQRIVLNTTYTVSLEMFPQNTFPWAYIAINNNITSLQVIKENATFLQFNSQGGTGPSLILVKVQSKPVAIQRNVDDPSSIKWSYDSSLSILRIPAIALGNFSIFVTPPLTIPRIAFQDFQGNTVATGLTWKIFYPDGTLARVVPGQLVENGTYTFQALYDGYLIYTNILTSTPNPVRLQMFPTGNQQGKYIAFNSTVNSITLLENTPARLQFNAAGRGPNLIIVNSPSRPLSIQLDGNTITSWTYNSTSLTIAIQSSKLGTFTITYSAPITIPIFYIGAIIGAVAIATAGLLIWERIRSRSPTQPPPAVEEKPVTKEQPRSKPDNPQKRKRGRL